MSHLRTTLESTAIAVVLCAAGCGDAERRALATDPSITDSAGVRTVVNYAPRWEAGEEWTVSEVPALVIGMLEGPAEYQFNRIRGVTRLSSGVIVVLNSGDGQLRYYGADGRHLLSVSGTGDGPGEMRGGRWLEKLEGDVVQVSHAGGRLRYGPDGGLIADDRVNWSRIHEVGRAVGLPNSAGFLMESCSLPAPMFVGDAVVLCASTYSDIRFIPTEPGVHESVSLVAYSGWALDAVETIGTFPLRTFVVLKQGGLLAPVVLEPPYGLSGRMRVGGTPTQLVYAPSDKYRIERYGLDAETRLMIERVGGLRPPTELEVARLDSTFARSHVIYNTPPDAAAPFRELAADSLSIISAAPYIDALNAVWARLDAPRHTFDIFDVQGIYLGQVVFPTEAPTIHEIGQDYILGVARDELDVEYVVMFELDRRTSG